MIRIILNPKSMLSQTRAKAYTTPLLHKKNEMFATALWEAGTMIQGWNRLRA